MKAQRILLFIAVSLKALSSFAQGEYMIPFKSEANGKWGYKNRKDEVVIEPQYELAKEFHEGLAVVCQLKPWSDGSNYRTYGYINCHGEIVIDIEYSEAEPFQNGWAKVGKPKKGNNGYYYPGYRGYINQKGEEVIPLKYGFMGEFSDDGLAVASYNGKYGFINRKGETVVDFVYDGALPFSEGFARVSHAEKTKNKGLKYTYGYINLKGELVIPIKYTMAESFGNNGLAIVGVGDNVLKRQIGFINKNGEIVIPMNYNEAHPFEDNGLAIVGVGESSNRKYGYINQEGKTIIDFVYDRLDPFYNGLSGAVKGGKLGFIDNTGNVVVPFKYEYRTIRDSERNIVCMWPSDFKYECAVVLKDGKWGLVDKSGVELTHFDYTEIKSISSCGPNLIKNGVVVYLDWFGNEYFTEYQRDLKGCKKQIENKNENQKPCIRWPIISHVTDQSQFVLKTEIKSISKIEYCKLYLNGVEVQEDSAPGGSSIVEDLKGDENHDITVNRTLVLREGKNTIRIKVKNAGGETEEEKTMEYKPDRAISGKAFIVWNDLPATTTESHLELNALVKSTVKEVGCRVLLNGVEAAAPTKGSSIVENPKEPEYKYMVKVQRTLALKENITNTIVIEVKDAQGRLLKSEQKQVSYTKPMLATIEWGEIPSKTEKDKFLLKAQIVSDSEIEYYNIIFNGVKTKGSYIVEDNHNVMINEVFNLREGENIVKIVAKNKAGEVVGEKNITYTPKEKRIALVMGNADYQNIRFPKLTKTKADAQTMYALFESYGFDMRPMVLDADLEEMRKAINGFIDEVGRGNYDVALLYYSGHGLSPDGGANYLIPIDADIAYTDEVKHSAINSKTDLLAKLEEKDCRVEILLLDCCNDCTLSDRGTKGAYNGGLSPIRPSYGISVIHAALPGQKALEGTGKNSPFVESFVECSESHPNVGWETFVNNFIEAVRIRTDEYQTPYAEGRILGKPFYINANRKK